MSQPPEIETGAAHAAGRLAIARDDLAKSCGAETIGPVPLGGRQKKGGVSA